MKLKFFRCVSLFTALSILMTSVVFGVEAKETVSEIDQFLLKIGTPQNIVDTMDEEVKKIIYDTSDRSNETDKEFATFEMNYYTMSDSPEGGISPCYIPESDLVMSVVAFKESNYNGYTQYSIYPSFEWKNDRHIDEDLFAFLLPEGWEVVSGKRNLRLWMKYPLNNQWYICGDIETPCLADFTGYGFDGFGKYCADKNVYKGTGYMYAYKKNSSASNKVKVAYAHENSLGGFHPGVSLGVSFYGFSISFSVISGSANMIQRQDIFDF